MRGVTGIKSIIWILAILRGVYGVMGPMLLIRVEYRDLAQTSQH